MIDAIVREGHFWWWSASRVLYDGATELITEFPFFSFYLGDNHAHLIGLPVLILGILGAHQLIKTQGWSVAVLLPSLACVVWSWRINPWQLPTALAFLLIAMLFRKPPFRWREAPLILLAFLPLSLLLWPPRAPGPSLSLSLNTGGHTTVADCLRVFGVLLPGMVWLFRKTIWRSRLLGPLILLTLGMWVTAELLYLDDVFQNRMNTVFKVYYQMWVLLALFSAIGWATACTLPSRYRNVCIALLACCLVPAGVYSLRLSAAAIRTSPKHLHAWTAESPQSRMLLSVADHLVNPGDLLIEAPGRSYDTGSSTLGTWTAGNTRLGWAGHQAQWRPGQQLPDPLHIYRVQSEGELDTVLDTLKPDWILWSLNERMSVTAHPEWEAWMSQRADRVIHEPDLVLFRVRPGADSD
jgi:uncharacterized membrane protein